MHTHDDDRQSARWLKFLDKLRPGASAVLAQDPGAGHLLVSFINEPVPGPPGWQRLIRGFRGLTTFAMMNIQMGKYPSLTRCWNDLSGTFLADGEGDGDNTYAHRLIVEAWVFCDFPVQETGKCLLGMFRDFLGECGALPEFQSFIDAMDGTRLGLHQEVGRTAGVIRFRELISGQTTEVFRSVSEFGKGEIFLCRIVLFEGVNYIFGDPKCWPKQYKTSVENMVLDKMYLYPKIGQTAGTVLDLKDQFAVFMKIAGPYWMSCVSDDAEIPILTPDHVFLYYAQPANDG